MLSQPEKELRVVLLDASAPAPAERDIISQLRPDIRVVAICDNANEAIDAIAAYKPALAIADAATIQQTSTSAEFVRDALDAGAQNIAILADDDHFNEIHDAALNGDLDILFLAPKPIDGIIESLREQFQDLPSQPPLQSEFNKPQPDNPPIQHGGLVRFTKEEHPRITLQHTQMPPVETRGPYGPYRLEQPPLAAGDEDDAEAEAPELPLSRRSSIALVNRRTATNTKQNTQIYKKADQEDPQKGQMTLTVFAPKGGVGKTTLAVNLAVAIALIGKKGLGIALADLDAAAIGGILAALPPQPEKTVLKYDLSDFLGLLENGDPQQAIEEVMYSVKIPLDRKSTDKCTLDVLPGLRSPQLAQQLSVEEMRHVIATLQSIYDVVILDAGDDISQPGAKAAIAMADRVIIPSESALPTSARVIAGLMDLMQRRETDPQLAEKIQDRLSIVITKYNKRLSRTYMDLDSLGAALQVQESNIYQIPYDLSVQKAEAEAIPVVIHQPKSAASRAIVELAKQLLPQALQPEEETGHLSLRGKRKKQQELGPLTGWFD